MVETDLNHHATMLRKSHTHAKLIANNVTLVNYHDLLLLNSIWTDINEAGTFTNFAQFPPFLSFLKAFHSLFLLL